MVGNCQRETADRTPWSFSPPSRIPEFFSPIQVMEPFEAVGQDLSLFQDVFTLSGQERILPFVPKDAVIPKDAVNYRPGCL
ncbi:hypothetical protein U0070_023630 [Myodes glareolus]|uniref:Uncharacterized protein n=1 Tax=Myodes glareolus TaxID=447135 RepID=A0AAW0IP00_MYOGA